MMEKNCQTHISMNAKKQSIKKQKVIKKKGAGETPLGFWKFEQKRVKV